MGFPYCSCWIRPTIQNAAGYLNNHSSNAFWALTKIDMTIYSAIVSAYSSSSVISTLVTPQKTMEEKGSMLLNPINVNYHSQVLLFPQNLWNWVSKWEDLWESNDKFSFVHLRNRTRQKILHWPSSKEWTTQLQSHKPQNHLRLALEVIHEWPERWLISWIIPAITPLSLLSRTVHNLVRNVSQ